MTSRSRIVFRKYDSKFISREEVDNAINDYLKKGGKIEVLPSEIRQDGKCRHYNSKDPYGLPDI